MSERRARWRRLLTAWSRPGDGARWLLVLAGLVLDTLWLPPGILGVHVPLAVLVADAPFLLLLWQGDGLRWKRWAFLYALVRFGVALHWLFQVGAFQWAGAVFFLTPVYVLLGLALRWGARRRLPFVVLVGLGVVLEEMLRTVWLGGMPWPQRSLAFADFPTWRAASALAGAYGLSFLAGMTSAAACGLLGVLRAAPEHKPVLAVRWFGSALVPALWALLLLVHGGARLGHHRGALADGTCAITPRLLVVQGDVPQSLKHAPEPDAANLIFDRHVALTEAGLREVQRRKVNLVGVLWPETMIPWPFLTPDLSRRSHEAWRKDPRRFDEWRNQCVVAGRLRAAVPEGMDVPSWFVGAIHRFERPDGTLGEHDSLFWIDGSALPPPMAPADPTPPPPAEGTALLPWERGRHDKRVRVPGGEYTPLSDLLPPLRVWRNALSEIPEIAEGAAEQTPFEIWAHERLDPHRSVMDRRSLRFAVRAGTVICFEIAFPARCRAWRRAGCQVLFNASNYGWFGPTAFRAQIRAVAALRAAELGQTVVMAGNTGPTCFFDPVGATYGDFHTQPLEGRLPGLPEAIRPPGPASAPPGSDATTFQTGFALDHLYADDTLTLYAEWGDFPWYSLSALLLLAALLGARRRRPGPPAPVPPEPPEGIR